MRYRNQKDREDRVHRQQEYHSQLGSLVQSKATRESLDMMVEQRAPAKHNPITNPIEYHIENPYFLQRMQARGGSQ
jgi:hypothetical protein